MYGKNLYSTEGSQKSVVSVHPFPKIRSWIIMLQTATPQTMILKGNWKEGHKGAMNYAAELYGIIEDLRKWNG